MNFQDLVNQGRTIKTCTVPGNVYSYLKQINIALESFCFLRTLWFFKKSARMNYVTLRPLLEKHKQPVKHISAPMASVVATEPDMSERFTHCHLFILQALRWCHTDPVRRAQPESRMLFLLLDIRKTSL